MLKLWAMKEAYLKNEDGATAIEYGLIAAFVALAIAGLLVTMGGNLTAIFTSIDTQLAAGAAAAP